MTSVRVLKTNDSSLYRICEYGRYSRRPLAELWNRTSNYFDDHDLSTPQTAKFKLVWMAPGNSSFVAAGSGSEAQQPCSLGNCLLASRRRGRKSSVLRGQLNMQPADNVRSERVVVTRPGCCFALDYPSNEGSLARLFFSACSR